MKTRSEAEDRQLFRTLIERIDPKFDPRGLISQKIAPILEPLDAAERRAAIDGLILQMAASLDDEGRLAFIKQLDAHFEEYSDPLVELDVALELVRLTPFVDDIERRAKDLILPPPNTAANVETLLMSYAYWITTVTAAAPSKEALRLALRGAMARSPLSIDRCGTKLELFDSAENASELAEFSRDWFKTAYARLEIGHKLAASLCLTDIPDDVDVHAPWAAWSLVVPDGLFGNLARVWCRGAEPLFVVKRDGSFTRYSGTRECSEADAMLRALVRGSCLALSNPDDFKKSRSHGPTARSSSKKLHGAPDLQQARFLLSAPVKIDFREHIASVLSGKTHAAPTVQFLVRGHWRSQAHGPHHSLRKPLWIHPFWKGPEDSRVLLRQHRADGEDPQATEEKQ